MTFVKRHHVPVFAGALVIAASVFLLPLAAAEQKPVRTCPEDQTAVADFKIEKGERPPAEIREPLSKVAGDTDRGLEIVADSSRGDCLSCHPVATILQKTKEGDPEQVKKYGAHGSIGTSLDGIGSRFNEAQLRLIVADPKQAFPDTDIAMPAYHQVKELTGVHPHCKERPILSAQEVEDVVAFLKTLQQ